MTSSALRTPTASQSPQYCEDCQHILKRADNIRASQCHAHPKASDFIAHDPPGYGLCVDLRAYYDSCPPGFNPQGRGFCPKFASVVSTEPIDPAAAVADSSTAANASRQNTEDACK
jgi:hypothetical protein